MDCLLIDQALSVRTINRQEDIDYFIDTQAYPVHLALSLIGISRMQFPNARALLIRTSPTSTFATLHILKDVDLYSSFINFEIDLSLLELQIKLEEGHISLNLTTQKETP
ncbi:MAG: hypothetical protein ACRDDX_00185 [Cellulosilyticaceae bacterium]